MSAFDADAKAQGAPGIDIEFRTQDGRRIAAEIKTTFPYQPGFGAKQREMISKDIEKLKKSNADVKVPFPDRTTKLRSCEENPCMDRIRHPGGAAPAR